MLALILFLLFGRNEPPVVTVEVTPPDELTSADLGFIIDGSADNRDLTSLIIYWAHLGYLSIDARKKKNIVLTKLASRKRTAL